jgi:imidazolonepropionase-like amidohydrolase
MMLARCILHLFALVFPLIGIAQPKSIIIEVGLLYNSESNHFLENQIIWIEGDQIKAVGQSIKIPPTAQVIKLPGGSISPGLIDAHTHLLTNQKLPENLAVDSWINSPARRVLRGAGYAREYLNAGFTAIRDLGNSGNYLDMELASAIRKGYVNGPHMFGSGPIISAMDGQFYQLPYDERNTITQKEYRVVSGVEDAVQAVKEHVNNGVDVIKIVAFGERLGLELEEMKAIVKTAHAHGLKVTAHSTGGASMASAIEAGVDGIEHAYYVNDTLWKKMAAKKIYMVPTDPSFNSIIQTQKSQGQTTHDTVAIHTELGPLRDRLIRAKKEKILLVAGSDAYFDLPVSRGDAAKEMLIAYVEEGLTIEESLQTATLNAAKAIGQEGKLGIIKQGVKANLVIFNGNLQKDFRNALFNVYMVIKDGQIVYTKELHTSK